MGESAYVSGSERRILRKSMTFAIEVELNKQYDMLVLEMATGRGVSSRRPFFADDLKATSWSPRQTARRYDGTTVHGLRRTSSSPAEPQRALRLLGQQHPEVPSLAPD